MKKVLKSWWRWVEFPKIPYSDDYFLSLCQIVGFSDLVVVLGVFLGLSIKYNRFNPIKKHPISMYSNLSTLNINILKGIKNPPIRWYLF